MPPASAEKTVLQVALSPKTPADLLVTVLRIFGSDPPAQPQPGCEFSFYKVVWENCDFHERRTF